MSGPLLRFGRSSIHRSAYHCHMLIENLADLRELIDKMDRNEKVLLRSYLKAFDSRLKGHKPKGLVLFDLIQRHKDNLKVLKLLRLKVEGRTDDALRMVISRLRDKVIQVYVLEVNLERNDVFESYTAAKLEVVRLRHAAHLLATRGARDVAARLIEKAVSASKKYELFHEMPDMMWYRHELLRFSNSQKEFDENSVQVIRHIEKSRQFYMTEMDYSAVNKFMSLRALNRLNPTEEYVRLLEGIVTGWDRYDEVVNSASVSFRRNSLIAEYHQIRGEFDKASDALRENIALSSHPAINTKGRKGNLQLNLLQNEIYRFGITEALAIIADLKGEIEKGGVRRFNILLEFELYCQFYMGHPRECVDSIEKLFARNWTHSSNYGVAVTFYLKACALFLLGDHRAVNRALQEAADIAHDREGWNVAMRVLRIINSIELGDFDLADAQIAAFYQFVRDGLKDSGLRKRDSMILQVLMDLRKCSYNFRSVAGTSKDQIDSLWSADGETAWGVLTPELVVFHLWFASKADGSPFPIPISRASVYR